jgi:hypothetical protein
MPPMVATTLGMMLPKLSGQLSDEKIDTIIAEVRAMMDYIEVGGRYDLEQTEDGPTA